jgi:transcriptional antiterminator RfaH
VQLNSRYKRCKNKEVKGMSVTLSRVETSASANTESGECGWYVAYTQPKREEIAEVNLQLQSFEVYLPRYKTFKKLPDGLLPVWQPMFPRYIFFRPGNAGQSISSVRSTRGVAFILCFGLIPAVLKPEELRLIQELEHERNKSDPGQISPFQPGLHVRLRNCGLQGLEGLVHSVSAKRVTLLIDLLGRQKKLSLEHHQVELL